MQKADDSHIISYYELVHRERETLQRGMNYRSNGRPSVFLMSVKDNAPYVDVWDDKNQILIYEGHDEYGAGENKKTIDQPMHLASGRLSDNGKFYQAAKEFVEGKRSAALKIQVYEKVQAGIWYDKGLFELFNAEVVSERQRNVFKFYLKPLTRGDSDSIVEYRHERMIPSYVKVKVWKRDKGQCVTCNATTGLHYDHIIPYSKGGRSDDERNIQLLCARHNLSKSDRIM